MTLKEWIANALTPNNIVALVCAVAVFSMGVAQFKGDTERRLSAIETARTAEKEQAKLEKAEQMLRRQKRARFQGCMIRHDDIYRRELRVQTPCELQPEE